MKDSFAGVDRENTKFVRVILHDIAMRTEILIDALVRKL